MRRALVPVAGLVLALVAGGGVLVAQPARERVVREVTRPDLPGRQVFAHQCAPCHGSGPGADGSPMLPGTAALDAKYGGSRPGLLELRRDLPLPVLRLFVRRGVGEMPAFRKSELTDAQLAQLADYLAATAAAN